MSTLPSSEQTFQEQEHECCHQCHTVVQGTHLFSITPEEQVILCPECCIGVYQCVECNQLVSCSGREPFREMVYGGGNIVWDEFFIFCRSCFDSIVDQEEMDSSLTDTEEESVFVCEVASDTQKIF